MDQDDEQRWRERVEQLQRALDSRIVIEQAKGILGERLGLDMEGAFAVLRYAARGARIKLQTLARQVVEDDETPPEVVRAVARHASTLARLPRAQRIAQIEGLFRALNEEIASEDGQTFLCECGNAACMAPIHLPADAVRELHEDPDTYVVRDGHELPDVETVVGGEDGYLIVRKAVSGATGG
jgi:hypothetical protein